MFSCQIKSHSRYRYLLIFVIFVKLILYILTRSTLLKLTNNKRKSNNTINLVLYLNSTLVKFRSKIISRRMSCLSCFEQDEEDSETNMFSTEDMEHFVEQFIQNQKFDNYLSEFFLNHQDSPVAYRQYYRKKKRSRPISSVLTGLRQPTSKQFWMKMFTLS